MTSTRWKLAVAAALLLALSAPDARAQNTTLTDNNASARVTAGGVVTVFRADGGLDNVFRSEYFFRVGDSGGERALGFGAAASTTLTGTNQRDTVYTANDGTYQASVRYRLQGDGNNATLFETVRFTSTSAASLALSLFSYNDYDLNFDPSVNDDRALLVDGSTVLQSDPTAWLLLRADMPFSAYKTGHGIPPGGGPIFPVRAELTDDAPTTLDGTPVPGTAFPAGAAGSDVAFALQWDATVASGATFSITTTRRLTTAVPEPGALPLVLVGALTTLSVTHCRRRRP